MLVATINSFCCSLMLHYSFISVDYMVCHAAFAPDSTSHVSFIVFFFLHRDVLKSNITLGVIYGVIEVCQFVICAIVVRFGAFIVSVPREHKFHTNFVNILV